MTNSIKFFGLISVAILTLALSGCGQSTSEIIGEKTIEKMIEEQSGGQAQVDLDKGSMKIESADGTFEAGENTTLPTDFPEDIYVIEGKIISAITNPAIENFSVSIETDKNLDEVSAIYQEKLKDENWKITGTMNFGEAVSIVASKDGRSASVMATAEGGKTTVILNAGKN